MCGIIMCCTPWQWMFSSLNTHSVKKSDIDLDLNYYFSMDYIKWKWIDKQTSCIKLQLKKKSIVIYIRISSVEFAIIKFYAAQQNHELICVSLN